MPILLGIFMHILSRVSQGLHLLIWAMVEHNQTHMFKTKLCFGYECHCVLLFVTIHASTSWTIIKNEVNGHGREITNTFVQNLYVYTICTNFASLIVCNATTEVSG